MIEWPDVSFADWELVRQGLCLEPLLQAISDFLDEQKDIIDQVRCDLSRGLKKAETGRSGLTPQQVLRSLVLMRVKNWNYRELRERIADGCTLRQFTDFYCLPVPRHDAFHRGFNRLTPETLKAINDVVVQAAVELGLEDGQKLRVDTTVVQTDIHHPTDNTLLWDVVRVVTRLIGRLAKALERRRIKGFRDRTRSARRMQEIQRMTTRQRQDQQTATYRELIGIAEDVIASARTALRQTRKARGKDMITDLAIAETRKEIEHFCGLGDRVTDQSRRRVLNSEQVPTAEKLYSIFEPHTDLIKRGKVQSPIEVGHKVFLAESARGLITQYDVLDGNPIDEQHVVISLVRHRQTFGDVPELYGSDRGFFSEKNVMSCKQEGVKVVCIPQRGGTKAPEREAYEKSREFKDGQRFRAGIEGRISVLFRGRGMKRCLAEGRERFELWVAAAVLANNLMKVAALLADRSSRRRKTA
ncbi:ISNCY family transposase [Bradyrhizobium sp. CNPSo 4026]|uniref:ISNCY family transposase n=1 Tax=Bradyrhizobium cenepequi TaxID=2821403 RepID=UPI001CE24221|nr:ISNCY family transposase [Bradyrhizobium cenepequi]MCA6110295.1 ISNCY family transposase [Bradyrhizobium cenepequi]